VIKFLTVWRQNWRTAILGAAWGIPVAAFILVMYFTLQPTAKERHACDQAVTTVLTTKDPLELERAMFLVQQLRCSIGKRL
jgi:cytochrome c-type biogenesis protein CcmH/NrfF